MEIVDRDQTAHSMQSDLRSTLSTALLHILTKPTLTHSHTMTPFDAPRKQAF